MNFLVWPLPLSPLMTQFMREALLLQTLPFSTSQEMLKALVPLMLWRYIGEGEQTLTPQAALHLPWLYRRNNLS